MRRKGYGAIGSCTGERLMEIQRKDHVLFTQGSWQIHSLFEDSEWVEIFHTCKKYEPKEDRVEYAYAIPDDTSCPGCGATQPDEIQGLVAMHNMDRPSRAWGQSIMKQMKEDYRRITGHVPSTNEAEMYKPIWSQE